MSKTIKVKKEKRIALEIPENFYISEPTVKKRICFMGSLMKDMDHIDRLLMRIDPNPKPCPHFTIDEDGTIYQHFDEKYYSHVFEDNSYNKSTVVICFSNLGWLKYNNATDDFENWYGVIVDKQRVKEKNFRQYRYWHSYTEKQLESAAKLCKELCDDLMIKKEVVSSLFTLEHPEKVEGIVTRTNLSEEYTDLNPSFELKKFTKLFQS